MKASDADIIIAEYMGDRILNNWGEDDRTVLETANEHGLCFFVPPYSESIDALTPAIERRGFPLASVYAPSLNEWVCDEMMFRELTGEYEVRGKIASEVGAIVLAKVINALK